jgi:hypothetical protein
MVAHSSEFEEQATCTTNGEGPPNVFLAVPKRKVGLNAALEVDPCGAERKSHKERDDDVVVAKSGLTVDGFQAILVIRVSKSSSGGVPLLAWSIPNRPMSGLGLWPLASHIKTPDPLVAAKYRERELEEVFVLAVGWNAREEMELLEVELVAWLNINSGTWGRDKRNKATPWGPATAPSEDGPGSLGAWVVVAVLEWFFNEEKVISSSFRDDVSVFEQARAWGWNAWYRATDNRRRNGAENDEEEVAPDLPGLPSKENSGTITCWIAPDAFSSGDGGSCVIDALDGCAGW